MQTRMEMYDRIGYHDFDQKLDALFASGKHGYLEQANSRQTLRPGTRGECAMSATESTTPTFKPKKSVALSGTAAGNTALCTVGRSGNDLHYRGYDILDIATTCEFEEIAHLLV